MGGEDDAEGGGMSGVGWGEPYWSRRDELEEEEEGEG